jgi:hypothetical protein
MPKRPVAANDPPTHSDPDAEAAFTLLQAEIDAVPGKALTRINLDVSRVVSHILATSQRLQKLADEIARLVEPRYIHGLRTYALAAWFAHLQALPPPKTLQAQVAGEAKVLRRTLLRDAEALADRGLFDRKTVAAIRKGAGYVDLATDLLALTNLFLGAREAIAGKTPVTEQELARAQELAPRLLAAAGRPGTDEVSTRARNRRARAFALLGIAYGQVRRAVTFLRWDQGDADQLAPPLHTARAPRRSPARAAGAPTPRPVHSPS